MKMGLLKELLHGSLNGFLKVFTDFAGSTAIHGLGFLVKKSYSVKERLFWALVFLILTLYASLQLRVAIVCKYFILKWHIYFRILVSLYLCLFFLAWYVHPIVSKTVVIPIENVMFPTVTMCPKNSNPDRWGPVIKVFDQLELKCNDQKWV